MQNSSKIKNIFITGIVTCGGLGFFPKGSGTVASFFACGFWAILMIFDSSRISIVFTSVLLTVLGTFAIQAFEKRTRTEDASMIVIDEWVGMGISLWFAKLSPGYFLAAFALFRLFDIWKPIGVRYFDRNHMHGWGVMLDDVVAGLYAAGIIGIYRWFF